MYKKTKVSLDDTPVMGCAVSRAVSCAVSLLQVNRAGNENNPIQKSAIASETIKKFAVVRRRRFVVTSQITRALPVTAKTVKNQPIIQNHTNILTVL